MMVRRLGLGWVVVSLLAAACAPPATAPDMRPSDFVITTPGAGDVLTVTMAGATALIDVHSPSGIGAAKIEITAETLPSAILLRLHLTGLELFQLAYDQTVITASVSSGDNGPISQYVKTPEADERPVTADTPYWLNLTFVTDANASRRSLEPGYFQLQLPDDFMSAQRHVFSVRWIDYYR